MNAQQGVRQARSPVHHPVYDTQPTTCCIAGAGPAGAMLALLLVRQGIPVTLLEAQGDFDRDFRGDSLHPSVLQILDELGLADRLLQLPHARVRTAELETPRGPIGFADFGQLRTRFPFAVFMPQSRFLEFITTEAACYPTFRLTFHAVVKELVHEAGAVAGVRYSAPDGWHEVRAGLTVGADGRASLVRRMAGLELVRAAAPMDVLWFRLPTEPGEQQRGAARIAHSQVLVLLHRGDHWQAGYIIPKGTYQAFRGQGIEAFRQAVARLAPELAARLETIAEWRQISLLAVEAGRVKTWFAPGLLLIGDAAHIMSPIGGVGINFAIQDAVVAANRLVRPLQSGRLTTADLAAIQRSREWPVRIVQALQAWVQNQVVSGGFDGERPSPMPGIVRLPILRRLPARIMGLGVWPVHVRYRMARDVEQGG